MTDYEKRNPTQATKPQRASQPGVGGRHSSPPTCRVGGGYPDICAKKKREVKDSQIEELRAIGLPRVWLNIADSIGAEHFVTMWRVLCQQVDFDGDAQRVYVPRFSTYLRYQRNRVILALCSEGKDVRTIQTELKSATGWSVTKSYIYRIIKQHKKVTDGR